MCRILSLLLLGIFCLSLYSCKQETVIVPPPYQPKHDHEAYEIGLAESGLLHTALGKDWSEAASDALSHPIEIKAPYREEFIILPTEAQAIGFSLDGLKGQKIEVDLLETTSDSTKLFLDAYEISEDSTIPPRLISSMDDRSLKLGFEIKTDGTFIIRFQPELLRGGRFIITIKTVPTLDFPVAGRDKNDIGSLFGVERDAGKRTHEGIDIFAKRHTPIIAPSDGSINMAGEKKSSLGGNVIWMRDTIRNLSIYFAHLEDVFVTQGDKVMRGDTIGSVGNSGNAITTYPHLHFGIYAMDGAIDPYHHVVPTRTKPSKLLANNQYLGQLMRTNKSAKMRVGGLSRKNLRQLVKNQCIEILGVVSSYYHVRLPDGQQGFVFYDDIATLNRPIQTKHYTDQPLQHEPNVHGIHIDQLVDQKVKVLATFENYAFVKTESDLRGWTIL